MIFHSKPSIGDEEFQAVHRVLRTGFLSAGPETAALETQLTQMTGREVACVSSGTAALHLGLLSVGITSGKKVAIPTHCCPSMLYALHYIGALPVLYDSGPLGFGSDPISFRGAVERADAVVILHQYGVPDIQGVKQIMRIPVVEDCATSIGAVVEGRVAGSFGDVAVFSFYATKMLAGGECGAVAGTRDSIEWIRTYRTPRGADESATHYPYSPSELSAALTRVQLTRLESFIQSRTLLANRYRASLEDQLRCPVVPDQCIPVWHRFIVETEELRDTVIEQASAADIQIGFGVKTPIHRLLNLDPAEYSNSERAFHHTVSLPIYPDLTQLEQDRIIRFMRRFR